MKQPPAIVSDLKSLFRETEGLPPFRHNRSGEVEGWPADAVARVSDTISSLVRCSSEDLREAILEIETTDKTQVPGGLLTLLTRAAWDVPCAPDLVQVFSALQQGLSLRDALYKCEEDEATTGAEH